MLNAANRIFGSMDGNFDRSAGAVSRISEDTYILSCLYFSDTPKACNNMLLAVHMLGTCEALAMGETHGLDPARLSEIILASSGRNWSLEVYNPWPGVMDGSPASNDYQPGFMVDLMAKDLGLAIDVAQSAGIDNAMGKLAADLCAAHQQAGNGPRDFSSVLERYRQS